jgi:hypothetical protein
VHLVEVDHVDAEPLQAGVAGRADAVGRQALAGRVGDLHAHLRGDHDLVAVVREPGRERALGLSVAVDVGGVEEGPARLEVAVEHPVGLVARGLAAHQHRAEGDPADGQRAELGRLHGG